MSGVVLIFLFLSLLFVSGGILFGVGLVGRLVGDHPHCAGCGFDLFGLPDSSGRCTECGVDVRVAGAIVIGQRARRWKLVWLSLIPLLIGLMGLSIFGLRAWAGLDVNQFKPVWLLSREAKSGDKLALIELVRRDTAGILSAGQLDSLVTIALSQQADRSKTWMTGWGDLVESAQRQGLLPIEKWQQYLRQAPNFSLKVRPKVRQGDPLPYSITQSNARLGSSKQMWINLVGQDLLIDGKRVDRNNGGGASSMSSSSSGGTGASFEPDKLAELKVGPHSAGVSVSGKISQSGNDADPLIVQLPVQLSADWELVPSDQPTVLVKDDPSLRGAIESAIRVTVDTLPENKPSKMWLNCMVNSSSLPVGVGFDVFARADGREWPLGSFARPAGSGNFGFGTGKQVNNFTADRIDIVMRPSIEAAAKSLDTFEIWNGEIVIKNVPVRHRAK